MLSARIIRDYKKKTSVWLALHVQRLILSFTNVFYQIVENFETKFVKMS